MLIDIKLSRVERARWYLLVALASSRPIAASEGTLQRVLDSTDMALTDAEMRSELDYLEQRGLVAIARDELTDEWSARLTADGVDFVQYRARAVTGIARPKRS